MDHKKRFFILNFFPIQEVMKSPKKNHIRRNAISLCKLKKYECFS